MVEEVSLSVVEGSRACSLLQTRMGNKSLPPRRRKIGAAGGTLFSASIFCEQVHVLGVQAVPAVGCRPFFLPSFVFLPKPQSCQPCGGVLPTSNERYFTEVSEIVCAAGQKSPCFVGAL